ncbi:MAG: sodium:proton antiporter [Planctomycetales bacterium]|nr:sodium:proton antiporter [Planctomycetales bacterium]NIM09769.1 sodium:proton antiporter [Planctomycetales bacterium]NIN09238.1 sodium:proton antiporter [Planctomycetales bacterium]NIN78338.1 sodium:proton antiporter [Planctomycetales bacterium]NIO35517.1 sodium:proton antiporter [Planctomycetales bacterium]
MEWFVNIVSGLCLVIGSLFAVIGGLGVLRLPDFYTRMHGAGITDTMGAGLILVGLMFQGGFSLVTVKLLMILCVLLTTSPTASHALAKSALHFGLEPRVVEKEAGS